MNYRDVADISRLVAQYAGRDVYGKPEFTPLNQYPNGTVGVGFTFQAVDGSTHGFYLLYDPLQDQWYRHEKEIPDVLTVVRHALARARAVRHVSTMAAEDRDLFEGVERCTIEAPKHQAGNEQHTI